MQHLTPSLISVVAVPHPAPGIMVGWWTLAKTFVDDKRIRKISLIDLILYSD